MVFDYEEWLKEQNAEQEEIFFEVRRTAVTTAGTRQPLTVLYGGHTLMIWADDGNTGDIYIGNRDVSSTESVVLAPGATFEFDLTAGVYKKKFISVFVDAATAADSVRWLKL